MNFLVLVLTIVLFALVMLLMAIGVMFRGRCLRGSCGGEGVVGPDGEIMTCDTCPRRKEKELEREQALAAQQQTLPREEHEPSLSNH